MTAPRILLVEDEAILAMTAEDMLEELGCAVIATAGTVEQALAAVDAGGFDLALLDINLNGTLSEPVARRLQEAGTPFALVTGYGSEHPLAGFLGAPVVRKPYTATQLNAAIGQLLAR